MGLFERLARLDSFSIKVKIMVKIKVKVKVKILGWLLCCLLCAGAGWAGTLPGQFSDELNTDRYDCLLTLQPEAHLLGTHSVTLALETGGGGGEVRCVIGRAAIRLFAAGNGKRRLLGEVASRVTPGTVYDLTLMRRGTSLALYHQQTFLFRGTAPTGGGTRATLHADAGWRVSEARIQRLEPVVFADDFMRTDADPKTAQGAWTEVSGHWALQSTWDDLPQGSGNKFAATIFAENPFAWIGASTDATPAICSTGAAEWEDYTYTVAINPDAHGAAGVLVNKADAQHGLLLRWSPANDRGPGGNALAAYRLDAGKRTLLASSPGGYLPGQWYRLTVVSSLDGVRVSVDDRERLNLEAAVPWRGGVGLYSEGTVGSVFDDVTVYGRTLDTDLLRETKQSQISQRFLDDNNGMKQWAVNPDLWQADLTVPGLNWYPDTLYGEHNWVYLTLNPAAHASGKVTLLLHGERTAPLASGYRAVITITDTPPRQTYTLYRGTALLASKQVAPLPPDTDYSVRLAHIGQRVTLAVDDMPVLQVSDTQPLLGGHAGYLLEAPNFMRAKDVHALSRNLLDYTFTEEPSDWWAAGTWMPSVRWACTPTWSFLGGWSRGDAVLWHKGTFSGDQSLEAFLGVKMEFPRERQDYFFLRGPGYFAVTICGNGRDPRSGYCGIYGAPDANGTPNKCAVLLRNGIEVASTPIAAHNWGANHHEWFGLRLQKQGNAIDFIVTRGAEKYTLSYHDTAPFSGGAPAIWTSNNAVSLARARINCAHAPTPRDVPGVYLDAPWYAEWANLGQAETLHFSDAWSTTGQPVALRVIPQEVPPADAAAATATGKDIHFTPTSAGDHWYQVVATDGVHASAPFHLDQTVFNPALGRDDSHALLLYRFDEGNGNIVHDRSMAEPALDLALPAWSKTAQWVVGQGLTLQAPNVLMSVGPTDKLLRVAKTKACTLEFWVSSETIFYPYTLLAWEQNGARNLTIDHNMNNFLLSTHAYSETTAGDFPSLRTSLQHYVFTWDGTTTHCYCNGVAAGQKDIAWAPEQWQVSYPLTLGRNYLGTFYLFALHDCCFTPEQVQRHYQAGPSAR